MSSTPFDAAMKDLIGIEARAAEWPALLGPWPVLRVDVVDADASTVTAAADKVLRVFGPAYDWLLHLEPHSTHKPGLPRRVHLYNTVLGDRHTLPVRSVVLLLRREANASNLTGVWTVGFPEEPDSYLYFRYQVVRVWEIPVETLLSAGLSIVPLAPLCNEAAADLPGVLRRIDQRLRQEATPAEADKLRAAAAVLMGLRYPDEVVRRALEGVSDMWEKVVEDSSVYQAAVKVGEERGIRVGEERGTLRGAKEVLLALGTDRFGPPDNRTAAALEALTDVVRVMEMSRRVMSASGWHDLVPPAPPAP